MYLVVIATFSAAQNVPVVRLHQSKTQHDCYSSYFKPSTTRTAFVKIKSQAAGRKTMF